MTSPGLLSWAEDFTPENDSSWNRTMRGQFRLRTEYHEQALSRTLGQYIPGIETAETATDSRGLRIELNDRIGEWQFGNTECSSC